MCWITRKKMIRMTADEDKAVYKVMKVTDDGHYSSFFQNMDYVPNQEQNIGGIFAFDERVLASISIGYHSYSGDCILKNIIKRRLYVYASFHYLQSYPRTCVVVKCIIPKGSNYYENEWGEIVSNKIVCTDAYIATSQALKAIRDKGGNLSMKDLFEQSNSN